MNADVESDVGWAPAITRCALPVSNHFPPYVRDALVAAACTPLLHDPFARVKAIDSAVEKAKRTHPNLFR